MARSTGCPSRTAPKSTSRLRRGSRSSTITVPARLRAALAASIRASATSSGVRCRFGGRPAPSSSVMRCSKAASAGPGSRMLSEHAGRSVSTTRDAQARLSRSSLTWASISFHGACARSAAASKRNRLLLRPCSAGPGSVLAWTGRSTRVSSGSSGCMSRTTRRCEEPGSEVKSWSMEEKSRSRRRPRLSFVKLSSDNARS
ncbi:hypothetical protein ADL06_17780 [Streptomyces sp. NRRL F-6491]|nr:hypothetical protein ADL06_17780 [Streptomyces sp. NRRL F-6491]KOX41542.1 hypothetical protein ADL08_18665 [Streptomyces sp. NRRL F-6492]